MNTIHFGSACAHSCYIVSRCIQLKETIDERNEELRIAQKARLELEAELSANIKLFQTTK